MLRDVTIHAVANGYVVTVGCQTFVFQNRGEMLGEISSYLRDPEGTEKRYREREPNMKHTDGVLGGPVAPQPILRSRACELNEVAGAASAPTERY